MADERFTPGPWAIAMVPALELKGQVVREPVPFRENDGSHIITSQVDDEERRGRVGTAAYRGTARKSLYQAEDPEGLANAHLMSAAPNMHDVLADAPVLSKYHGQRGFEVERFITDYENWMGQRGIVLSKARGES